jgi:glycosyltransferase involved in cell wall biosynthesis
MPQLVTAKRIAMAENKALQRLDAAACVLTNGSRQFITRYETPFYEGATPEVSVVVSLYNYAGVVLETLNSITESEGVEFEVIVVEDHATDSSRLVVRRFVNDHPHVPIVLIAKDANEGLAAARNTGFEAARAPLVMVMDADNAIYPSCLRKLADALAGEPRGRRGVRDPRGLRRSAQHPQRAGVGCRSSVPGQLHRCARRCSASRRGSDSAAIAPTTTSCTAGRTGTCGLRLAATGGRAMLVTQILGRYRVQQGSMIALTNLATDEAISAMRDRYPSLPWPAEGPV